VTRRALIQLALCWCLAAFFTNVIGPARAQGVPEGRPVRNCVTCHAAQAKPQRDTSMAHAMESVAECTVLRNHPILKFQAAGFSYRIERKRAESTYSVTDGKNRLSFPIKWALGLGSAGQTYVFEYEGALYESLVSYYQALDGLDITMGDQNIQPTTLMEAAGRRQSPNEAASCLGCHTTDSQVDGKLNLATLIAGVQCERCHGDSTAHVEGFAKGRAAPSAMKKTGRSLGGGHVAILRPVPSHLGANRDERPAWRAERPLSALPAHQQPVLRRGRPAHQVHGLSRSTPGS